MPAHSPTVLPTQVPVSGAAPEIDWNPLNNGLWNPLSPMDWLESSDMYLEYSGTVTAYNLSLSEIVVDYIVGTPTVTVSVDDGTSATPTITLTSTAEDEGRVALRILAGAVQNGAVDNLESDQSAPMTIDEPK